MILFVIKTHSLKSKIEIDSEIQSRMAAKGGQLRMEVLSQKEKGLMDMDNNVVVGR